MRKNVFREAYEHTKQKGYVSAEKLDELAREIVPSLGSKDVTFVAALVHGVRKTVRSHAKIGRPVPKALLENFLRRTLEELSSQVSTADRALLAKYVVDGIGSLDFNCKKYLAPK